MHICLLIPNWRLTLLDKHGKEATVRLVRISGDDSCNNGTCPTVFAIDEGKGEAVVQGYTVTDAEALAQMSLPPGESAVRVPLRLLLEAAARLEDSS